MNSKEYLNQSYRLNERINAKMAELDRLRELASNVRAVCYDTVKVQGGNVRNDSRQSELEMKILDIEERIKQDIDRLIDLREDISRIIDRMKKTDEQLVLRYRYLCGMKWEDIAEKMSYSVRQVHNIHGRAIQHIKIV